MFVPVLFATFVVWKEITHFVVSVPVTVYVITSPPFNTDWEACVVVGADDAVLSTLTVVADKVTAVYIPSLADSFPVLKPVTEAIGEKIKGDQLATASIIIIIVLLILRAGKKK